MDAENPAKRFVGMTKALYKDLIKDLIKDPIKEEVPSDVICIAVGEYTQLRPLQMTVATGNVFISSPRNSNTFEIWRTSRPSDLEESWSGFSREPSYSKRDKKAKMLREQTVKKKPTFAEVKAQLEARKRKPK